MCASDLKCHDRVMALKRRQVQCRRVVTPSQGREENCDLATVRRMHSRTVILAQRPCRGGIGACNRRARVVELLQGSPTGQHNLRAPQLGADSWVASVGALEEVTRNVVGLDGCATGLCGEPG
jgi:hypothetical protein